MNSHGISKNNLLTVFPIALQKDKSAVSIGDGTAELLAARLREIDLLRIYTRIDELDEELLDILAYDFKVDWWDPNYSVEEKRRTLKGNWYVHKKLGTKAAVISAISAIHPHTELLEWFEYDGGKPYHFKLAIDVTGEILTLERNERLFSRVDYYKNLRSHCDEISYTVRCEPHTYYIGGTYLSNTRLPLPEIADSFDFRSTVHTGGSMAAIIRQPLIPIEDKFNFSATTHVGGMMVSISSSPIPAVQDALAFEQSVQAGGTMAAYSRQPVPLLPDERIFKQDARAGGFFGKTSRVPIPNAESRTSSASTGKAEAGGPVSVTVPVPEIPL